MDESFNVNSLAAFKRFLAQPGAAVECIQFDDKEPIPPRMKLIRKVKKVQTNAVQFEPTKYGMDGSWLYFKSAKEYFFDPSKNEVTAALDFERSAFTRVIKYRLHLLK